MAAPTTHWEHPGFASTQAAGQVAGMIDPNDATYRPLVDADLATGNTVLRAFRATGAILVAAALLTTASAAGAAGVRLPHGAAPAAPVNGDVWTTTAGMYARINGVTQQLASGSVAYSQLPTGSGSWDTGAGTTLTLTRAVAIAGTLGVNGLITGNAGAFLTSPLGTFVDIQGNAATGNSFGLRIRAGTNTSDMAFRVFEQTGSAELMRIDGAGNAVFGPYSVSMGGTLAVTGSVTIANNVAFQAKDSFGNAQEMVLLDTVNRARFRGGVSPTGTVATGQACRRTPGLAAGGATLALTDYVVGTGGFLLVVDDAGFMAIFGYSSTATFVISDPRGIYSAVAGTASKINVYYAAGVLTLQNNSGGGRGFTVYSLAY